MEFPEIFFRLLICNSNEKIRIRNSNIISSPITCLLNQAFLVALSPKFAKNLYMNPSIKELSLPINENIEMILKGTNETEKNELFLKLVFLLDNKVYINRWKKKCKINEENAIDRLLMLIKFNGNKENMIEEFEFIGKNIEYMLKSKKFIGIPNEYICEIFKHVNEVNSEKNICQAIMKRYKNETDKNIRQKLINCIEIRGLNNIDFKELMDNINFEEVSEAIFKKILSNKKENEQIISQLKSQLNLSNDIGSKLNKELLVLNNANSKLSKDLKQKESEILNNNNELIMLHKEIKKAGYSLMYYVVKGNLINIGTQLILNLTEAEVNSTGINS